MTVPFPFVANAVLTAAQLNAITSLPTTAKTASATLTAAEAVGYRVTMTSASATTITINTAVFATGDTVFITNLGTGVCTVTAGTATVSTAGSLAIPQYGSGVLVMTATGTGIYYPSGAVATRELAYAEKTTDTSVTSTTTNGADICTTSSVTFDGSTVIIAELYAAGLGRGGSWIQTLFAVDGTRVYITGYQTGTNTGPATSLVRYTPTAGAHTFGFRANVDSGTGSIIATSPLAPSFIRISRAA